MAFPASMTPDVAVLGEIYLDHVFSEFAHWPGPGEEIFTDNYVSELGGGAVTTACALARLGRSVQLIGVVGERQFPMIAERLAEFGVDAGRIVRTEGRTGVTVSVSTKEDRSFFTYAGANGELSRLLKDDDMILQNAAQARHVHLAFPLRLDDAADVIRTLQAHGATVSLDVGHQVEWLRSAQIQDVLQWLNYFLPNEKEAAILAGSTGEYLSLCGSLGVGSAVVKLGAAGAVLLQDGAEYRSDAMPDIAVDTTGAGDVFDAGLIDALLDGLSPQVCLQHACACATLSTSAAGALSALPTREEAKQFAERFAGRSYVT